MESYFAVIAFVLSAIGVVVMFMSLHVRKRRTAGWLLFASMCLQVVALVVATVGLSIYKGTL